MKRSSHAVLGCLVLGLSAMASIAKADVVVGTENPGLDNDIPFGNEGYSGEYQQLYASSAFAGPITITALQFGTISAGYNTPGIENLDFTVGLEATSASPAAPADFATNIAGGPGLTQVFNGSLVYNALNNNTFDLTIPIAPFTYNPGDGNLLMDVDLISASGVQNFLMAGYDPNVGRVGVGFTNAGYGLVTNFVTGAAATPEPGAYALLGGMGLTGLAAVRRRRSR